MAKLISRLLLAIGLAVLVVAVFMPAEWRVAGATWMRLDRRNDEATSTAVHFGVFFFACACSLPARLAWPRRARHVLLLGLAAAVLTELLQTFSVDREPGLADVLVNSIGVVTGTIAGGLVRRVIGPAPK